MVVPLIDNSGQQLVYRWGWGVAHALQVCRRRRTTGQMKQKVESAKSELEEAKREAGLWRTRAQLAEEKLHA